MQGKPLAHSLGTALLLLTLLAAETLVGLDGAPHILTLRLAEVGFAIFASRALLAVRPVGPWLAARPRWLQFAALALIVLALFRHSFWTSLAMLGALLLFSGLLAVEFLDDAARTAARPPRFAQRRPLLFGGLFLGVLALVALAHDILARGLYLSQGDTPLALAFGVATFGLAATLLIVLGLVVAAALGKGRGELPRRVIHVTVFVYLFAWFLGYNDADALGTRDAGRLPLLALGIVAVQFAELLLEAPERAARRAMDRRALPDLFLAIAFGTVHLLATFGIGGMSAADTVFNVKAIAWAGFLLGALVVPLARRKRRHASAVPAAEADGAAVS